MEQLPRVMLIPKVFGEQNLSSVGHPIVLSKKEDAIDAQTVGVNFSRDMIKCRSED